MALVAIRAKGRLSTSGLPSPRDGLQWPHFVKADHLPPMGVVAIDLKYSANPLSYRQEVVLLPGASPGNVGY